MVMAQPTRKAIIVGMSGASSSGKTTLSRLLQRIFPNCFIVHEDDFSQPESKIPIRDGLPDWDCVESLVIPDLITSLEYIQRTGTMPQTFKSKEQPPPTPTTPLVSETVITELTTLVTSWTQPNQPGHHLLSTPLFLLDGFLLYTPSLAPLQRYMNIKLFLQVSYAAAKERRAKRSAYTAIEGIWVDPEGYFDGVVWPRYVGYHGWMFEGGDVEGEFKASALSEWDVKARVGREGDGDGDMEGTLKWAVETLMKELEVLAVT